MNPLLRYIVIRDSKERPRGAADGLATFSDGKAAEDYAKLRASLNPTATYYIARVEQTVHTKISEPIFSKVI